MADNWSALKPATDPYTDCPYRTAVSTMPSPGSIRGGATGMNWMSRAPAVNSTNVVRTCGYWRRCQMYTHARQPMTTAKCSPA